MLDNVFEIAFLVGLIVGSGIRSLYGWRGRKTRIKENRRSALGVSLLGLSSLGFLLPLLYVFSSQLDSADIPLPAWVGWLGAVVFALALWLLWRSHADLGLNWSKTLQIRDAHTLVTHGVYRHIRHPMYTAHWLWGIAQLLLLHNWVAGPSMLVFLAPLYFVRVPREERMMLDQFGDEYRAYMNRTGRIVPRFHA